MDATRPVKLAGKLPKGNADGLGALYDLLRQDKGGYAVVHLGTDHVKRRGGMPDEPTAFIVQIEGCASAELVKAAVHLMGRARRERMEGEGADTLPREHVDFGDLEDESDDVTQD